MRKLQNDKLHSLFSSPSIVKVIKSRRTRWEGHVARMEKWEDNIKMDLRETGIKGVNWILLAQVRVR